MVLEPQTNEEKLSRIYEMTKENHDILISLRRGQRISGFFRVMYWLLIVGAIGSAYYYVTPFLTSLTTNGGKAGALLDQVYLLQKNLPETQALHSLIEGLKKSATASVSEDLAQ